MKIAVMLSGGIDSTVAALILKEQGYDVLGLTMVNWDESVASKGLAAARWLDIEHQVIDLSQEFKEKVVDYFCSAYEHGYTPNPCVECNKHIKFGALLDKARQEGCELVATGHYAQIEFDQQRNRYLLKKGLDKSKDQSYFLYGLNQEQLAQIIFPLGRFSKSEVKDLASQKGLELGGYKESQEICFVPRDYRELLKGRIECRSGEIIDIEGRIMGKHSGLGFYTVGQRKGLGISADRPLYVTGLDNETNTVQVGDNQDLYGNCLTAEHNNFIYAEEPKAPLAIKAKIRYAAKPADATIFMVNGRVKVEFDEPQRAITRGQSVVYYLDEYVYGGGIIC